MGEPERGRSGDDILVRVNGPPIMVESGTPGMRGGRGGNAIALCPSVSENNISI